MLPNHSPLTIAEQFGTLETLHPGRIDLGLGRAPGTDQNTMHALRRNATSSDSFPEDVLELQAYLRGESRIPDVSAYPGTGTNVPLYILGSSLFGAGLAASLGLPYAFASHFAPAALHDAIAVPPRVQAVRAARQAVSDGCVQRDRRRRPGRRRTPAAAGAAQPRGAAVATGHQVQRRAGRPGARITAGRAPASDDDLQRRWNS
ncbi:MsnO8 family LLM class oxidoreductase [Aeromicrobium sp. UC242_57]|uniref:MsnO8 family LLM class oxidoreductase n=1 Tax=Aeromicrobium sp. UC242_57 TaxID=3374624 RepID=UPI00379A7955